MPGSDGGATPEAWRPIHRRKLPKSSRPEFDNCQTTTVLQVAPAVARSTPFGALPLIRQPWFGLEAPMKGKALSTQPRASRRVALLWKAKTFPGKTRKLRPPGQTELGTHLFDRRRHEFQLATQRQNAPLSRPERDLLEELKKSMKRLKVLEGLKTDRKEMSKPAGFPEQETPEPVHRPRRASPVTSSGPRRAIAIIIVGLLLAVAAGWALYVHWTGGELSGPRWKDESGTYFTFAAVADFGTGADSLAIVQRARTSGMSFFLALGDFGRPEKEAAWCGEMKHYLPEFVLVPGNHDVGEDSGGNISEYVKSCPYPLSSPVVAGVGTPGYGYEYYFDYPAEKPLTRFIVVSPGLEGRLDYNYSKHSSHTEWMEDAVDDARDQGIPWVIVAAHSSCITVGKKDHCSMGQDFFDELVEAEVDMILVGHDHVYERSKQLDQSNACESVNATNQFEISCVASDGSQGVYPKGEGSVVVVQGVGGDKLHNVTLDGSDPEIGYFAEAMGMNANTKGRLPGFGSVFYRVTADSISVQTDFCPPGQVAHDGHCTANLSTVFEDRFSIGVVGSSLGALASPRAGASVGSPNASPSTDPLVAAPSPRGLSRTALC